jgi:hypothetical protein
MDEPKPLDSLFKEKLFRIPDYQRGYAWGKDQLNAFWEDLVNLPTGRSHYTGVLTLKEIPAKDIKDCDKEYWLVEDHSYKMYHIVDGQQRLTTFVIFLQAFVEFVRSLPENKSKHDEDIYITDTLSIVAVQKKFLFMVKPHGDNFRTYKFGYTTDNPSYQYMRYRILNEEGSGTVFETFYTLNLSNAKRFFLEQFKSWHAKSGLDGLQAVYRTLTKRLLFNEYIIKDEFDVFVAFETMNNRGKKLSDLELLKNRLIYLTTLYTDEELDPAERASLRDSINDSWKEVYYQLGRNKSKPLNDDDFLRAHWTMYFKYSRKTGRDYIRFLLDEQFTPQRVHRKVVQEVSLEEADEQTWKDAEELEDEADEEIVSSDETKPTADLSPAEIRDYVLSLKESSVHWFATFHPDQVPGLSPQETEWIDRLNRVGMAYFRPLIMAILKNVESIDQRIAVLKEVERFLFIVFKLTSTRSNYRSSEFYNVARGLDKGEIDLPAIVDKLKERLAFTFEEDGAFRSDDFYNQLFKKFDAGVGYYGWSGLRYFLYEYELSLLSGSRQKKVGWNDLLKTSKDRISIEHIYPQTPTKPWAAAFKGVRPRDKVKYAGSLGNMLLLSAAVNSALQNDSFEEKKHPKHNDDGEKVRNGFSDGSHSEIEVSKLTSWGPDEIRARGLKLLKFMEKRWGISFSSDQAKESILFLPD